MLQIKDVSKQYKTGDLVQTALDNVSLTLRENEFVAILGPSGSGKTTLLNIIGGLDRYDSGDLIINGISTKKYNDRDWDSYRNHTIGFVFQSYNLIPHQTILANVELALTISGISKTDRKRRAKEALEKVGLGNQIHKKPNQLSGGQMQRVAIARALVNNPSILLADEPTGALDSDTSVQIMDMLKEVAKDRLVVMVTHNPELAEQYATRIVKLKDGNIIDDSNPCTDEFKEETRHENMGRSSMSRTTSLALSFNNLKTKKARTLLTSFAGSIGIIGISLILSLSTGVSDYINLIQKETMASYPITIDAETIDISAFMKTEEEISNANHELDGVYPNSEGFRMAQNLTTNTIKNNLYEFKKYLDSEESEINQYVGDVGIAYTYDTVFDVFTYDPKGTLVNTDGSTLEDDEGTSVLGFNISNMNALRSVFGSASSFSEMTPNADGTGISSMITDNYDVLFGHMPKTYNEIVLVLDGKNEVDITALYQSGFLPTEEYKQAIKDLNQGNDISISEGKIAYEDICNKEFYMIPACDRYLFDETTQSYRMASTDEEIEEIMSNALKLNISGVIRLKEDIKYMSIATPFAYTKGLTDYIVDHTNESELVKKQIENPDVNALNGISFIPKSQEEKVEDAKKYLSELSDIEKVNLVNSMMMKMDMDTMMLFMQSSGMDITGMQDIPSDFDLTNIPTDFEIPEGIELPNETETTETMTMPADFEIPENMDIDFTAITDEEKGQIDLADYAFEMSNSEIVAQMNAFLENPDDEVLAVIYDICISPGSYEENMEAFGVIDLDRPSSISIYADNFEDKDAIADCIEKYNKSTTKENEITYTDYVGMLMSSVTTIIHTISYVLIAFVSVSLIVSSIMIGIITYISVLERTKEIGILRAIGASKKNISQVFNAETFIIGLCSGLIGIVITLLLLIPGNIIIHAVSGNNDINAVLPFVDAVALIVLSIILTLIGGFIPSKKAAKKDPVLALRTE